MPNKTVDIDARVRRNPELETHEITFEDAADDKAEVRAKVRSPDLQKRVTILTEDTIWIAEQSISRWKATMERTRGVLEPAEHRSFLNTAEQVRKLQVTANEMAKETRPKLLSEEDLEAEFEDECRRHDLDPEAVKKVLGI